MNESDSERIAYLLRNAGYESATTEEDADLIILNTCAIRDSAERKVWGRLGRLAGAKRKKPGLIIAVGGCMAQRYGAEILSRSSSVDIVFGTRSFARLPQLIRDRLDLGKPVVDVSDSHTPFTPQLRKNGIRAFVTISTGCDNYCSYCVVPYVRGRLEHRDPDAIIREVTDLAEKGYKEVTLIGQNVNSYLCRGVDFPSLLRELNPIEGIHRIRFVTSHPKDVPDELISAMSDLNKVCEHLHLPVQSGSDRILRLMNRGYTRSQYLRIIENARDRVPGIAISTDFIVGFPGETETDYLETCSLAEQVQFDSAFCYRYSERSGTKAARMIDDVPEHDKRKRLERLITLTSETTLLRNRQLIGARVEVLAEGKNEKRETELVGRTRDNRLVFFECESGKIGELFEVVVEEAGNWFLRGRISHDDNGNVG